MGTIEWLSPDGQSGNEHSRKDDLTSVAYMLVYFFNGGNLPWDYIKQPEEPYIDEKLADAYDKRVNYQK